jgi:hypothetical protein
MKRSFILAFYVVLFSTSAFAQSYDEMLGKVKGGDLTIDFKAFRLAYADKTPSGSRSADPKLHAQMFTLLNEKKFKDVINVAEGLQKANFVDMNSHIATAMAYQGLADAKKAKFHEDVYLGLVNSILKGADGNSPKTAYHVISVSEELVLLNALELKPGPQTVETADGHTYHLMTATDKTSNEAVKIYFNIDKLQPTLSSVPKS